MPLLKVDHLTKKFGGLTAVNDLSFELEEAGIHALVGPNGSGKTTTINMISGVYPASSGVIEFDGCNISKEKSYKIARLGLHRTYQNIKLYPSMTLLENLLIGGHSDTQNSVFTTLMNPRAYQQEERALKEKGEEMLKFLGLYEKRNVEVGSLPYGNQKITELGIALMSKPKLLLLDEPAAGLNPSERRDFIDLVLKVFDQGVKILMVEHNMDVVMSISKHITVLNFGSKIAEGSPQEIQNNEEVIAAYLGDKFKKSANKKEG